MTPSRPLCPANPAHIAQPSPQATRKRVQAQKARDQTPADTFARTAQARGATSAEPRGHQIRRTAADWAMRAAGPVHLGVFSFTTVVVASLALRALGAVIRAVDPDARPVPGNRTEVARALKCWLEDNGVIVDHCVVAPVTAAHLDETLRMRQNLNLMWVTPAHIAALAATLNASYAENHSWLSRLTGRQAESASPAIERFARDL